MTIISLEQYRNGEIGYLESYELVVKELKQFAQRLFEEKKISSFFGYGSAFRGDYNFGSDVDGCFITNCDEVDDEIADFKTKIYDATHIVIEDNPIDFAYGLRGEHSIVPSFRQHLEAIILNKDCVTVGANPIEILKRINIPIERCARNSLNYRRGKFHKKRTKINDEEKTLSIVKSIIEEPLHVARIYLQYHHQELFEDFQNDTKDRVLTLYKEKVSQAGFSQLYDFIELVQGFKQEYTQLLQARVDGENRWQDYEGFLKKVQDQSLSTKLFFNQNLETMGDGDLNVFGKGY